jgi:hypothetical protein
VIHSTAQVARDAVGAVEWTPPVPFLSRISHPKNTPRSVAQRSAAVAYATATRPVSGFGSQHHSVSRNLQHDATLPAPHVRSVHGRIHGRAVPHRGSVS